VVEGWQLKACSSLESWEARVDRLFVFVKKAESIFVDHFRVWGLESREASCQDSRNHEVQNPEKAKIPVGEPTFAKRVGFQYFDTFKDKGSSFFVLEFPKS
jgi:hypothetical protein